MTTARKTPAKKVARRTKPATTASRKVPEAAVLLPTPEEVPTEAPATSAIEKQKLVRDSFTMPKREYEQLGALKSRLMKLEHAIKKSELLRAGVAALTAMSDDALLSAVEGVQRLKTGRPEKEKATSRKTTKKKL